MGGGGRSGRNKLLWVGTGWVGWEIEEEEVGQGLENGDEEEEDLSGWVGGWVEENEAVGMRCCGVGLGG